ncbi:hypothetical protein SDC9_198433 [bioreactor metagenome]|uniref:Uncharacterized protein n=1 Tax=bioreactor metagenome TaxID=1076179 RepID=A0A645IR10_9ZZZZ
MAGKPAANTPWAARQKTIVVKSLLKEIGMIKKAAPDIEITMVNLRSRESARQAMANIDTAIPPLAKDIAKLATAGAKPNSLENTGISGCVQ